MNRLPAKPLLRQRFLSALATFAAGLAAVHAAVSVSPPFTSNMVLQRGKPCPVWGTAAANKNITVSFNGQSKVAASDVLGKWRVNLDPMVAKTSGGSMTISEAGGNTLTLTNVVVGDVWICSGQSNMAWSLASCDRPSDVSSANYPGIRHFSVPLVTAADPQRSLTGNWSVCSSSTAGGFSAVAFYFGRKIYTDQSSAIPIGLITSSVGGTTIDPWLVQEGLTDIPVLAPLYSQQVLPWGPFALANGMIHPLAPFACKGVIWYQGENREATSQSNDSYFLKQKALAQGWKRMFGLDDFAFYVVLLANWGTANSSVTPDTIPGATWADTRIQQGNVVGLPHAGVASAIDIGDAADIHPKDKLDVGERLALWALKNDYGRTSIVPSGPILRDVTISGNTLVCSFDHVGAGLMVGSKIPYQPTTEVVGGTLTNFSIAGATGSWYAATAVINPDNTITVSSPSVATPRRVAYACWQNPAGCNLYNRDGLPANPFYVDDATAKHTVTATAGSNGSISPAGTTTYLKRKTALYKITPDPGYFVQDVTVDGVPVGAVTQYGFDPLYSNRAIHATFTASAPSYTIAATSTTGGGTLTPSGNISVPQGGSQTFNIAPSNGNLVAVAVDGKPMGQRDGFTFADVRANRTLATTFSCTISAQAGYGGTITPTGTTVVGYGTNQTYTIAPISGFSIARVTVDGVDVGAVTSHTFTNVTGSHTITATFVGTGGSGSVPQQSQILFSCLTDSLPAGGSTIGSWSTYQPSGQSLAAIGNPVVEVVDDKKFVLNSAIDSDGFRYGNVYSSAIPCSGASVVVVAKPARYGSADSNWQSLVDVFYNRLVLGIMNGSGKICVRRNGSLDYSSAAIPEGQTTILSLVVQSNGTYKVYANGNLAMNITGTSAMTSLDPLWNGGTGFWSYINVGRNNPDGWTTFNGHIGDVFLYKTALSDTERVNLETYLVNRLAPPVNVPPTISTVAEQAIAPNSSTAALPFTVGDTETPAASLTVTASSSNTTLVPNANIVLGGSGANRTVTVTPAANLTGSTTITLMVSDGLLAGTSSFTLNVSAAPLTVGAWQSVATHVSTPRALGMPADAFVEPRASGVRRIEVVFSKPIIVSNPAAVVSVSGVNAAGGVNPAGLGITVNATVAGSTLALEFSNAGGPCALPDAAKWRFTLDVSKITGTDGAGLAVSGETSRVFTTLTGDFDGNGRVNGVDLNEIAVTPAFDPSNPACLRADIDLNGTVTAADLDAAWSNRSQRVDTLPSP